MTRSGRRPARLPVLPAALPLLWVAVLVLLLSACAGAPTPSRDVDVDTPQLRGMKADAGIEACEPGDGDPVEGGLPEVTLACLGGGEDVDLSTLRGPMVVNVWASNCPPCREEMPALEQFHQRYGDQVAVLGIDYQDNYPEAAIALADDTGATYPQLADPLGDIGSTSLIRSPGVPQFAFVDADGAVVANDAGGKDSLAEIVAMVEKRLDLDLRDPA